MQYLTALLVGLVFGLGLIIAGMANPSKIIGFLDVAGPWDPSLAFVMGGAIAVSSTGYWLLRMRREALTGVPMQLPTNRTIDRRLVLGSLAFGTGWGLAGLCPAPAIVALGAAHSQAFIFVAAMLAGMGLYELIERRRDLALAIENSRHVKRVAPHSRTERSSASTVDGLRRPVIRTLSPTFATTAHLAPAQLAEIRRAGFQSVINNRPDQEDGPGQPSSDALAREAARQKLTYAHLPVSPKNVRPEDVEHFRALLASLPAPVLAFCRTGNRSARLYREAMANKAYE